MKTLRSDSPKYRHPVQVKKRASALVYSDIESNVEQFALIRAEHQAGRRSGTPHLWLVSNAPPSESLATRVSNQEWPDDMFLRMPMYTTGSENEIPLPGATMEEQFRSCVAWASRVEYSTLSPETLVWKLAAWVQDVASGAISDHEITPAGLQPLLEQFVVQLQQFPSPPHGYRAQENEPPFVSPESIRRLQGTGVRQNLLGRRVRHSSRQQFSIFRLRCSPKFRHLQFSCEGTWGPFSARAGRAKGHPLTWRAGTARSSSYRHSSLHTRCFAIFGAGQPAAHGTQR